MDEVVEVTLEMIYDAVQESDNEEQLQEILESLEEIKETTETTSNYTQLMYHSVKNIETYTTSFFVLALLAILSTVIVKTFFTGW